MSGGRDLAGPIEPKRGRGRPKGSTNRRAKDLKGYVEQRFGGSAAQQMAAVCMVTPKEVREAGGVFEARLVKAAELAVQLKCSVKEAWDLISKELAALAPYTDQRQPLAIELPGERPPAVVFMGQAPVALAQGSPTDIAGDFRIIEPEVSRMKSHDEGQATELLGLSPPPAAD